MERNRLLGVGAGIVLGLGGVFAFQASTGEADAASVSAQLKINQRISSAAVKRSNEALTKITALTAQVAALSAGTPGAPAAPLWGVSNGSAQESLVTSRGGNGVLSIFSSQNGRFTVKFNRNVAACTYSATIAADNQNDLGTGRDIRVALDLSDAARSQLTVFTSAANGNATRAPFHIQTWC